MKKRTLKFPDILLIAIVAICLAVMGMIFWNLARESMHVDLNDYPVTEERGILTDKQLTVYRKILEAADSGTATIPVESLTVEERRQVMTQLGLYYGSMEGIYRLIYWHDGTATLNLYLFRTFAEEKAVIDARVDEAVSSLYEGSDRYMLWQISNYLAERIQYTPGARDTLDGLNGQGVCSAYAMLFYKMATRLGIQTYICCGDAGGDYHAWNMVELDGARYYYDVTWYDSPLREIWYLHSRTPWGRDVTVNML